MHLGHSPLQQKTCVDVRVCNIDEEGRFGGPERRITLVAEGLLRYGIRTLILIPMQDSEKFEAEISRHELWYQKIDYSRLTLEPANLLRYILRFPIDLAATVHVLRKHRVSIVHVNGSYQFRSAIAAVLASKKVVWHVNDAKMHCLVRGTFQFLAPRISDAFIFSSAVARNYYFPRGFDMKKIKSATIAPPVQIERFSGKEYENDNAMSRSATPIRIVTVSGINPDKGLEHFIEAAAIIYSVRKNVTFQIAAAIHASHLKYFGELKELIRSKGLEDGVINFLGFVDDIPKFLQGSDIFLYTSNTEAGPAAVWEAMAATLPVVTTNVGAIPEYLTHGVDALIAQPQDAEKLAQFTLQLIDAPELRSSMGRSARRTVRSHLSVDAAAQKHADLYSEVMRDA